MYMVKNYSLIASDGEKLRVTTFCSLQEKSNKTLVFVHGFKGFKDWGFGPYIGGYFADKGYSVILFNFSHNGIGENLTEFTEFDKFAKNTFSREIRELNEVLDVVRNGFFEEISSDSKIGICGHSRGGAISLLTSSQRDDVNAVAVWASIAKLDRYSQRQKEEWRKNGSFDVMNLRTKQIMSLGVCLLDDIELNSNDSLNIEKAVKNLNKPLLIAHGVQDLAVSIDEAELIYGWSDKSKTELYKIYGCGHTFDVAHPFAGTTKNFEDLLETTDRFFSYKI
ncbi:MAG: alpha/beta hydrolase fold protein [Ignavibacteria bacterium]|nr:MAG: alpha/beta hydrolase fold protein [Ignavibacteria bacterium]KAF0161963.1 MAG: alpha/beta hydrolase fold protein [Ignavibacteria bacterium]